MIKIDMWYSDKKEAAPVFSGGFFSCILEK